MAEEQFQRIRPAAVADAFYPGDAARLNAMIDDELAYASRALARRKAGRGPQTQAHARTPWPKAVIVPHAGYVYSGATAALAYSLLAAGCGTVRRAVIVGPTHRVPVRGVAMCSADAWRTPLGTVRVDVDAERAALDAGLLIVNDPTHEQEHAVEVQVPFLQKVLGPDIAIVPLNAGDATPREVADVLRALWGGPETVIVISSDLSHYHPERVGRAIDDETIGRIAALDYPIAPDRACGAYPINGLLDAIVRMQAAADSCRGGASPADGTSRTESGRAIESDGDSVGTPCAHCAHAVPSESDESVDFPGSADSSGSVGPCGNGSAAAPAGWRPELEFLGCCTSGDDGEVALAGEDRPAMCDPRQRVVGYASWALWEVPQDVRPVQDPDTDAVTDAGQGGHGGRHEGSVLLRLARTALAEHLGIAVDGPSAAEILRRHAWLDEPGASFVTLTENGRLRGCIGSIIARQPLGRDVAEHAVDAAVHDPRFYPVGPDEYPLLRFEVSVLSQPEPMPDVRSRAMLERTLRPGVDGLILEDGVGHAATFLPQVWDELPEPRDFVGHLLAKAGLTSNLDWKHGEIAARRYTVRAYR